MNKWTLTKAILMGAGLILVFIGFINGFPHYIGGHGNGSYLSQVGYQSYQLYALKIEIAYVLGLVLTLSVGIETVIARAYRRFKKSLVTSIMKQMKGDE